jgi:hypothetical protein
VVRSSAASDVYKRQALDFALCFFEKAVDMGFCER